MAAGVVVAVVMVAVAVAVAVVGVAGRVVAGSEDSIVNPAA